MINRDMLNIECVETLKIFRDPTYNAIFLSFIRKNYENIRGDKIRTIERATPSSSRIRFLAVNSDCLYKIKGVKYNYDDKKIIKEKYDLDIDTLNYMSKRELQELGLYNY